MLDKYAFVSFNNVITAAVHEEAFKSDYYFTIMNKSIHIILLPCIFYIWSSCLHT